MNDNDVIKAMECCTKIEEGCSHEYCFECPMFEEEVDECTASLFGKVLDLIKRQQAEIEQWKEEANRYQNLWCDAEKDISNARIEAQKDFAERLKQYLLLRQIGQISVVSFENIDNLVKELTEGK